MLISCSAEEMQNLVAARRKTSYASAFPSDVITLAVTDLMLFRPFIDLFEFTKWSKMVWS